MTMSIDERIRRSRELLLNPYAFLGGEGEYEAALPQDRPAAGSTRRASLIDPDRLLAGKRRGQRFSRPQIEAIVQRLHVELWRHRPTLWQGREPTPAEMANPAIALESIGLSVGTDVELGEYAEGDAVFQVAGLLDRANATVRISERFPLEIRNFTMAHELGHAVLHDQPGLHRDRALDGSAGGRPSEPTETEANMFAGCFLMPARPVREAFQRNFGTERFTLNEETAFALGSVGRVPRRTRRDLSRALAGAEHYAGAHFESLAGEFHVSIEAMAIRLEDLDLIP